MTNIQALIKNPYARLMRLHQPVGALLLMWPCWWGVALASRGQLPVWILLLFALGAFVMRGAGCVINDLWDRELDTQVERTRTRPLASGELSTRQAVRFLAILLAIGLLIAALLGWRVVLWSLYSLPLVALYPLMKRLTWWPQAFLALTFNWGALVGAVAVQGYPGSTGWLLYAAGFFWTLGYDTIYAYQDLADDKKAGVKSSARALGEQALPWLAGSYAAAIIFIATALLEAGGGGLALVLLLAPAVHFCLQLTRFNSKDPAACGRIFRSNAITGGLIFLTCIV